MFDAHSGVHQLFLSHRLTTKVVGGREGAEKQISAVLYVTVIYIYRLSQDQIINHEQGVLKDKTILYFAFYILPMHLLKISSSRIIKDNCLNLFPMSIT